MEKSGSKQLANFRIEIIERFSYNIKQNGKQDINNYNFFSLQLKTTLIAGISNFLLKLI